VQLQFEATGWLLRVADDGEGRAAGLVPRPGLGGVRKRVKLLGGEVQWLENARWASSAKPHSWPAQHRV
jgi:signal transduction histidine kinase